LSRGASGKCTAHGGGRCCKEPGCEKLSQGAGGKCRPHRGGVRCKELGCEKYSVSAGKCIAHGGGQRCDEPGCEKLSKSAGGKCTAHGGGQLQQGRARLDGLSGKLEGIVELEGEMMSQDVVDESVVPSGDQRDDAYFESDKSSDDTGQNAPLRWAAL
jgi:hypothetical protein